MHLYRYVARAAKGGASGEITIRESLVSRLATTLGVDTDVARSDKVCCDVVVL